MLQDLGFALRLLVKKRTFTLAATATLAIGIGGTTVMFTIVDAVLIRALSFPEPERLVWGWGRFPQSDEASTSPLDFQDDRAAAPGREPFPLGVAGDTIWPSLTRPDRGGPAQAAAL